ncbi:MAG TPA: hypothetical protein VGB98_11425 [Pyrinomonadaceae bacterium]
MKVASQQWQSTATAAQPACSRSSSLTSAFQRAAVLPSQSSYSPSGVTTA